MVPQCLFSALLSALMLPQNQIPLLIILTSRQSFISSFHQLPLFFMLMLNKVSFETIVGIVVSALPFWLSSCLGDLSFSLFSSLIHLVQFLHVLVFVRALNSVSFFFTFLFLSSLLSLCDTPHPLIQADRPLLSLVLSQFFSSALSSEVAPLWC